jgi:DNA-binding CsgD family transcriptional regulator
MPDAPLARLARWRALFQTDGAWVPSQRAALWSALAALEPGERESIVLWASGVSVGEIADLLDEASGTIAYLISSARSRLAPVADDLPAELRDLDAAAPAGVRATSQRRGSPMLRFGLPIAAVLVVAVIAIVGIGLLGRGPAPVGGGPAGSGSGVTSPSAAPVTELSWRTARFPTNSTARLLTVAGERIVALGQKRGEAAGAWYSDDGGESWIAATLQLDPPTKEATVAWEAVTTTTGDTLVAAGSWSSASGTKTWKSWLSQDRGKSWREAPGERDGSVLALLATRRGVLAATLDFPHSTFALWSSPDGTAWTRESPAGLTAYFTMIHAMTPFRDVYVAAGSSTRGSRPQVAAWISADGRTWSAAKGLTPETGAINDLAASGDLLVAVGAVGSRPDGSDATAYLWRSPDGQRWDAVQLSDERGVHPIHVGTGSLGSVALGVVADKPAAWYVAPNATEATQLETSGRPQDVVALPDRFVAVGDCADAACTRSQVFIGTAVEP